MGVALTKNDINGRGNPLTLHCNETLVCMSSIRHGSDRLKPVTETIPEVSSRIRTHIEVDLYSVIDNIPEGIVK